jgi:hypothetical protein
MFGGDLRCLRAQPGNVVCLTLAICQHGQHVSRRHESSVEQDRRSILSRRHVAEIRLDPWSHAGWTGGARDQQLGYPVLRVGIVLLCPLLRLQGPCQSPDVFSSPLLISSFM